MLKERICPYPGLRPFNEEESIFFKGREEHIDTIISQLQEKKFLMVTGASGDGKSSIIYAGLIPRSRAGFFKTRYNNWLVVDFRPERSPLTNFAKALNKHFNYQDTPALEEELSYGFSSLVKTYKNSGFYIDTDSDDYAKADENKKQELKNKGANLLILVDQFEELFTNSENFSNGRPSIQAITLINLIIETTKIAEQENLPVYIVCTMRSDYIGDCAAFKGLPELIVYSQFFVPRLKRQEIHRAILEPANLSGNKIANRLIERLINELGDGLDQLPILQHALNRIWRSHVDDNAHEMDLLHYAKVGGMHGNLLPDDQKTVFINWYREQPFFKQNLLEGASLSNVLNAHARELFEMAIAKDIAKEEAQQLLQRIFTCLTKINDGRAVRNRASVQEIVQIIGNSIDIRLIEGLVNVYREPENTLLKPFITEQANTVTLKNTDILDITHESLIRNWTELVIWTKQEHENTLVLTDFKKQLERWEEQNRSKDYLLTTGSLSYFKTWYDNLKPNASLIAKYDSSALEPAQKQTAAIKFIASASDFIQTSENAIKRRRRAVIFITAAVGLVLLGFTYFAYKERDVAVTQKQLADKKTEEAKASEKKAVDSEKEALHAKNAAIALKEDAEKSEKVALAAKQQAEISQQEALRAKALAEAEKRNAQEQRDVAKTEKSKAEEAKQKAEQEKTKAEVAELKSRKLKLLSVAQSLALKSALYKKNKEFSGQLAVQAYNFHKNNGGMAEDPVIYEGLRNAYSVLDSNKHSIINGIPMETRSFADVGGQIISVGLDGVVYKQDCENARSSKLTQLKYAASPINTVLFAPSGNFLITGHDNNTVALWNTRGIIDTKQDRLTDCKELKGHKDAIRAAVLNSSATRLLTSGKDSLIIIWKIQEAKPIAEKTIKTSAPVKSLILLNESECVTAHENGKISLWNIETGTEAVLFNQTHIKPISMVHNKNTNALIVGFSDGTIKLFNLKVKSQVPLAYKEFKTHTTAVEHLVFNNDFSLIASAAADKTIKLYNYTAFFETDNSAAGATELKNHNSKVKSIIFTNDNKLVAGCTDKTIRIWETSSQKLADKICGLLKTKMSETDWRQIVGEDIPYEKTCESIK